MCDDFRKFYTEYDSKQAGKLYSDWFYRLYDEQYERYRNSGVTQTIMKITGAFIQKIKPQKMKDNKENLQSNEKERNDENEERT